MPIQEGGKFSPTQKIVSPGVFTRENDLTVASLAQGVQNIGGAVVAPFSDGPAFRPTAITDVTTLESMFGAADGVYYGPYAAKEYLLQQGVVTVVRVGGLTGYWQKNPLVIYACPGQWARTNDAGALTTASYVFLDTTDYTSTVKYVHSASIYLVSAISASNTAKIGYGSTQSSSWFGVDVTGTLTTKAQITAFLAANSYLPNIDILSASLGKALGARKLLSLTTTNFYPAFSSSIVDKSKWLMQSAGGSAEYTPAYYDVQNFIPTGSLYYSSGSISAAGYKSPVTKINSSVYGTFASNVRTLSTNSSSYLRNAVYINNGQITWPFIFVDTAIPTSASAIFAQNRKVGGSRKGNQLEVIGSYDNSYVEISGNVSGKFGTTVGTSPFPASYNGTGTLYGSQVYAGKQVSLGSVSTAKLRRKFTSGDGYSLTTGAKGYFFLSSSIQGTSATEEQHVSAAIEQSRETISYFSSSVLNTGATSNTGSLTYEYDVNSFDSTQALNIYSGSFKSYRIPNTCDSYLQFIGIVKGEFGPLTGVFEADAGVDEDPCFVATTGRRNLVLGVLANTQNASTEFDENYTVNGFEGSIVTQLTSSTYPYKDNIDPNQNRYELTLKYNINGQSGTYGCYEFSLNESDNGYIKQVFGTDPTLGNPQKQVTGNIVNAAYNYILFEDSIKKFIAEKVRPNREGGGWKLTVSSVPKPGVSLGESLKFVDQYSYKPTEGDSQFSITNARTPWILSQKTANSKCEGETGPSSSKFKLFRIHTLSDGTVTNTKYKIEISNVKLAGTVLGSKYGSFNLAVRAFVDNDKRPQYVENYQNLNLDPDSPNFIARRIGDKYSYVTFGGKTIEYGDYANQSRMIRVEMTDVPFPETSVPYGFEAYSTPVGGTLGNLLPPVKYSKASIYGVAPGKYASGTVFGSVPDTSNELNALYPETTTGVGVEVDTKQYFKPLPYFGGNDEFGNNIDFDLEDKTLGGENSSYYGKNTSLSVGTILAPSLSGSIPSTYDAVNEATYVKLRKFVVGFQGGFDGQWPALQINVGSDITAGNTQGLDCTSPTKPGYIAYEQCIKALGNSEEYDINLIVLPGIFREVHKLLTDAVIEMVDARGDCFYIMDNVVWPANNQTKGLVDAAIETIRDLNTNYVSTYYPWIKIADSTTGRTVSVPPSVIIPSVYAANDAAAGEWYAPAGLNRGGIPQATQVLDRLTHDERDTLYENRINPIASFPGQGIVVWGQKTLQLEASALDRVNVRRLLINIKKFVASTSNYLVFEYNVAATRNRFLSIVNPYLESIQSRNGIYAYQIKMDDTNNTQDLIDRQIIYGQIYIQPAKAAEYVILDFNLLPSGASFGNA